MARSLILGGTKGLGRALAIASLARGVPPIVVGRSAAQAESDKALAGADFRPADLTNPLALANLPPGVLADVSYVFWVAGIYLRGPLSDCSSDAVRRMTDTHFTGPIAALSVVHRMMKMAKPLSDAPGRPYHLVAIAGTLSWRVPRNMAVLAGLVAAKAQFTRAFARELFRDLPGSKASLVHPGGMDCPNFFAGSGVDHSGFPDPASIAAIVWERALAQEHPYDEYGFADGKGKEPQVVEGVHEPEWPR